MEEEKNTAKLDKKGFFRDFIDNITGVLFSPAEALRKVSFERKIAQGLIVLILSHLLPSLAAVPGSADILGRMPVSTYGGMTMENIFPGLQNMVPSLVTMGVIFGVLICPMMHFVFTAVLELTSQFLGTGVTALSEGEIAAIGPLKTGPALFAALAFATLPRVFMTPVNLLVRVTGVNLSPLFSLIFWIWVMILQIIAVRETHGFTTGRATLAYFAPVLAVAALVIALVVMALSVFVPAMRNFW
ncbi:YIP1 family protein [Thermosediminibacter litoriperuensis]|uniref:Yip1 domain-containing protein n=1 Tax=Thermosediminibacter litoriperuensis TaxID=291989 RepID=A0A5S5ANS1_9FIRM|nr:YIP1 family protein [Thermosediminibacter litoriperuensis]TYP52495.1 hypothetical protein LZ11_01662 [Thermosediminibacter litoriperuensis]